MSCSDIASASLRPPIAQAYALEQALELLVERARLMQALPQNGAMAAVFPTARPWRRDRAARAWRCCVAALNGPQNTVISGA